ncbi:MAG: hypothetical protein MUC43_14115, partial [Pirellula sp.]|nr:hypothetical protein [Pirellula sp.]
WLWPNAVPPAIVITIKSASKRFTTFTSLFGVSLGLDNHGKGRALSVIRWISPAVHFSYRPPLPVNLTVSLNILQKENSTKTT